MYIQIVNFGLKGMTAAEFRAACDDLAPSFAEVPGLLAKVWLANSDTNTYGGVYTWRSRDDMLRFQETELFEAVVGHPNFEGLSSNEFDVIERPTLVTRGLAGARA